MGDSWSVVGNKRQNLGGEDYLLGGLLGEGGYAKVFAATRVIDGKLVAIKEVKKADVTSWDEVNEEIVRLYVREEKYEEEYMWMLRGRRR